jgi:hypothetical protein
MTREKIVKEVNRLACKLHKERGIPMNQACALACRAVIRTLRHPSGFGLGQDEGPLARIKQAGEVPQVKAVREAVSPWLWVLSIASFVKNFFFK